MRRVILAALALTAAAVLAERCAHAGPPRPDERGYDPSLAPWFQSLKQPDNNVTCCTEADCRYVEYRINADGHYEIQPRAIYDDRFKGHSEAESIWTVVPDNKVLHDKSNPAGHAVACYATKDDGAGVTINTIYCFVPALGV